MSQSMPRPDWVMLGEPAPDGNGVWLYASRELTSAELRAEADNLPSWLEEPGLWVGVPPKITITAQVRRFHVIQAPTYGQAFEALFRVWSPDDPRSEPAQIEGRRALPG